MDNFEGKKVVAYIRKSSEDTKDGDVNKQVNSFSYQKKVVDNLIKEHDLDLLTKVFQDDHSGYKAFSRVNFDLMLKFIEKNEVDGIVCYDISRLARNFGDGGYILWYLQCGKIKFIFTHDKVFTSSHSEQLMVAIDFAMAKHSSDATSSRTKQGLNSKVQNTKNPHYRPILGYKAIGKTGGKYWTIDEKIGSLVQDVFKEFATGKYTLQEISDFAFNIGLKSGSKTSKTQKISKNTWKNRLTDKAYIGIFVYNNESIIGKYTPLISEEVFYRVQELLEKKSHPKSEHFEYTYTGIVQCNRCGGLLSGTHKKGINYYRCGKKTSPCKELDKIKYINEKDLEFELVNSLECLEIDQPVFDALLKYFSSMGKEESSYYTSEVRKLEVRINDLKNRHLELVEAKFEGTLTEDEYQTLKRDNDQNIRQQEQLKNKYESITTEMDKEVKKFLSNIKHVTKRFRTASPQLKRSLVEIFCENLRLDDKKLRWDWKKPYYFIKKNEKNSIVLPD